MSIYNNKNNKFITFAIVLIGLFIVVLFTKNQLVSIYQNIDIKETYANTLQENKTKLQELNNLKNNLEKSQDNINKYIVEIKEDEIIDYVYSSIEKINGRGGVSVIKSVTISEPIETELGFKKTLITVNLRVPNENNLKAILDIFTSEKSKYKFYVNSLSFPYGLEKEGEISNFNVSIPLILLYK